jgi:hypothetical protein
MSYENAVPKPLKFLISDGKMIDDAGNVITESETLKDLYTKWEPEVKKYLLSDGSVVDEEGNLIIKNDWWKSFYEGACPQVQKYLHADGTISENLTNNDKVYGWKDSNDNVAYFNFSKTPEDETAFKSSKLLNIDFDTKLNGISIMLAGNITNFESYTKNSDTEFEIEVNGVTYTYTRDNTVDFELWEV